MRAIKLILVFLAFLAFMYGCIYPYDFDVSGSQNSLVINGRVTDIEGYQYINISRSVSLNNPSEKSPISGCTVSIMDDRGNVFPAEEKDPGIYASWISSEYLTTGTRFILNVTLPDGKNYTSEYDELLACPPIDDISWEIEEMLTQDPDISYQGFRFNVTTDGSGEYAKNFRWELEEAWEYHSTYMIRVYFDSIIQFLDHYSDSLYYCWNSGSIPEIYTYSTRNLSSGQVNKFPLHFVSDQTDRLSVKYSLLVRQFSLTPTAYDYWNILDDQLKQSGELYETQPANLAGNIHSLDNESESVVGLFYASSIQEKRIFVRPGIITVEPYCFGYDLSPSQLMTELTEEYTEDDYPIWLLEKDRGGYDFADQRCFDCRRRGGSTVKPYYWE